MRFTSSAVTPELFSFDFSSSCEWRRSVRTSTRPSSTFLCSCFTSSLRRSSLRAGMFRRMTAPSLLGVSPRSEPRIAFSIALMRLRSHGWMTICRGSGALMAASDTSGVAAPYASTSSSSTRLGAARSVRTLASWGRSASIAFFILASVCTRPSSSAIPNLAAVDEGADRLALRGAHHGIGLRDVKHDDGDVALFGERGRRGVHHPETLLEEVAVTDVGVLLRALNTSRIGVVHTVHRVLPHEDHVSVDLGGAQRGRRVAGEERVPGARGEDDEVALLEMMDRASPDVRFGDLRDGDGRLHPRRNAHGLELRLQRERVDDHGEHAHVMRGRLLDPVLRDGRAAHDVPAPDHHRHLYAEIVDLLDLEREVVRVLGGNAELPITQERLAGKLQQHPGVLGLRLDGHRRQSRSARRWTGRAGTA